MPGRYRSNIAALLIAGNERSYYVETDEFHEYLIDEARYNPSNIRVLYGKRNSNKEILNKTQEFITDIKQEGIEHLVFLYNGHASGDKFYPTAKPVSWKQLATILSEAPPFLFINNSCDAEMIIPVFKRQRLLPKKNLVLAAAKKGEYAFDDIFLHALIDSYREKKPFRKKEVIHIVINHRLFCEQQQLYINTARDVYVQHPQRSGVELDYLLYRELR